MDDLIPINPDSNSTKFNDQGHPDYCNRDYDPLSVAIDDQQGYN